MCSQLIQVEEVAAESITYMDTALYRAAIEGQIESFRNHLQQGSLPSLRTIKHNTALHVHAAAIGKKPLVKVEEFLKPILEACPSLLQQPNAEGQTALHIAAMKGEHRTVKFLIDQAMCQSQRDPESKGDAREAARVMLRKTDLEMNTALHLAVRYNHLDVVKALLEFEDPGFCYGANKRQKTPLYLAAKAEGGSYMVGAILDKFESAAATHGGPHGRTALHAAAMRSDPEISRRIVEKKGNCLARETDENGHTPLHYAAHLRRHSVVKELLKCDKSVAFIGDKKWEMTPLLVAARQGHIEIVKEILKHCPDCCEKVDKRGWNVLHFLRARGVLLRKLPEIPSVSILLKERDKNGVTPRQLLWRLFYDDDQRDDTRKLVEPVFDDKVAEEEVRSPKWKVDEKEDDKAAVESQLFIGTLIATVAFAAAITVPGGYRSEHEHQGTPFLLHSIAFQAFVISDALAFLLSLSAIGIYYDTIPYYFKNSKKWIYHKEGSEGALRRSAVLISFALIALSIAFSTGIYVALKPAPLLAIASCFIGSIYFVLSNCVILYSYLFLDYY